MFFVSKFYPDVQRAKRESLCKLARFFIQEGAHNLGVLLEKRYPERADSLRELLGGPSGFCREKADMYKGVQQVLIDLGYMDMLTQKASMRLPETSTQLIQRFSKMVDQVDKLHKHVASYKYTTPRNIKARKRYQVKTWDLTLSILREYGTLTLLARDVRGNELRQFASNHSDTMVRIMKHVIDNEGDDKKQQEGLERWRVILEES